MALPANMNGPLPFPKTTLSQLPILNQGMMPLPGSYIPREASVDPTQDRNRDFGTSLALHHFDHVGTRSCNNSPVPGPATQHVSSGKSQTVFIHKLFDMLKELRLSHLIWWSPSEDSFCLYPGEEFSNVLAQYFKHTNIASFIRQLNMYGFHKVNDNFQQPEDKQNGSSTHDESGNQAPASQQTRWEFRHSAKHFRKGDVESLSLIKRKLSKVVSSHKEIISLKTLPPTSEEPIDETSKRYHLSVFQQLWNQVGGPGGRIAATTSADKEHPPRQASAMYAAPAGMMVQYPYPLYAQLMGLPHSPNSPLLLEQPAAAPSYFLQLARHPQPLLQSSLRQTSVQTLTMSLDLSIDFRLIELNTTVNGLKAAYLDLLTKHESLAAMHHKGQADLLQLAEIIEKMSSKTKEYDGSPRLGRESEVVDGKMPNTPFNRVVSPHMSPTTVKPAASEDSASFKNQLKSKINNSTDFQQQQGLKVPQSYHLNDMSPGSAPAAIPGIVPQQYPLNPNYTLYNNAAVGTPGPVVSPIYASEDTHVTSGTRPAGHKQVSALMDPLQVISQNMPSRANALTCSKPAPETNSAKTHLPGESGKDMPDSPVALTYVQQCQPFAPAHASAHAFAHAHAYYQHMVHDPSHLRTMSLPTTLHPLPQRLGENKPERHSMNLVAQAKAEEEKSVTRSPVVPLTSRPVTAHTEPVTLLKAEDQMHIPLKKKLPSMEELNKSLRSGSSNAGVIFNIHPPSSEGEDELVKRRKIEE